MKRLAESDRFADTFIPLRGRFARPVMGIVQETYVRVCQIENKDAVREPQSYIFRTAKNLALDHVMRAASRLTAADLSGRAIPIKGVHLFRCVPLYFG
jgi:DNA-directed RNA polymerase specialized sigma24 family protein